MFKKGWGEHGKKGKEKKESSQWNCIIQEG